MCYRDKYNTNRRMDHLPFAISSNLTSQTEFLGRVSGRAVVLGLGRRVVVRRVGRLVVTGGLILPITNTHYIYSASYVQLFIREYQIFI